MSGLGSIQSKLGSLDRSELEQLKNKVSFLIQNTSQSRQRSVSVTDFYTDGDWLFDGIVHELAERGILAAKDSGKLKRLYGGEPYHIFKANSAIVKDSIKPFLQPHKHSKPEFLSLGIIFAGALAVYQERWKTIETDTLLRDILKLPSALEYSYPGYLRSGMLWAPISGIK